MCTVLLLPWLASATSQVPWGCKDILFNCFPPPVSTSMTFYGSSVISGDTSYKSTQATGDLLSTKEKKMIGRAYDDASLFIATQGKTGCLFTSSYCFIT